MYPELPLEFVIHGIAVSLQGSASARAQWIEHVRETARQARGVERWALGARLAVTLFYFPAVEMQGDLDNIVKPILDGMSRCLFLDDRQIERIVIQRFEPAHLFAFEQPSVALAQAMGAGQAALYVRITGDLHEDLS